MKSKRKNQTLIPIVTHHLSSKYNKVYVIPLSDMQIGNPSFDEDLFLGYRDWILERDNAFTVLPGDNLETPVLGNKAADVWDMYLTPEKARKKLRELLKPLADAGRILGAVDGNHDIRTYQLTGHRITREILEELGCCVEGKNSIYDPEAIVVRLVFGKDTNSGSKSGFTYSIYMTHGWGGARRTGAHVNKTEELAAVVTNADVYMIGHEHTLYDSRWDSAVIPTSHSSTMCHEKRQVFVGAGTFCRYTRFQKRIQRRLPNLGSPRIRLEGVCGKKSHKDIHVSI